MDWVLELGKFDPEKWAKSWQELFDSHELVYNERKILKIVVSNEKDGAFAVVDIDTLWKDKNGNCQHWQGRVCKVYSKIKNEWKLIMHTGALRY